VRGCGWLLTLFSCKNEDTERVLQETVQETTNKMNRVLKQETTNEVIRIEMEGKIREEELKKRVLVSKSFCLLFGFSLQFG
jgi:hypothetical protein